MTQKLKEHYFHRDTFVWYDFDTSKYRSSEYKVGENALYPFGRNNYVKCKRHIRLPRH